MQRRTNYLLAHTGVARNTDSVENATPNFDIPAARVAITLNAVLAGLDDGGPKALCLKRHDGTYALPYGPFDPERHRTLEIGIREWVGKQTNVSLGFVEQLYTFGDKDREASMTALKVSSNDNRIVSVGYLALTPVLDSTEDAESQDENSVKWMDWYAFFPWEDWRHGKPGILSEFLLPQLNAWSQQDSTAQRRARIALAFGLDQYGWEEERTLDRYELMFEAGLIDEAFRHSDQTSQKRAPKLTTGLPMHSDHRRILATAIGRLRGKLKYRPIIFEMMQSEFTLLGLQKTVEAIVGFTLHKQNFRRSIEKSGFVKATNKTIHQPSGRPAALFKVDHEGLRIGAASGLTIPRIKR